MQPLEGGNSLSDSLAFLEPTLDSRPSKSIIPAMCGQKLLLLYRWIFSGIRSLQSRPEMYIRLANYLGQAETTHLGHRLGNI